ncbi:hypothetical protein EWM64_g5850 [Hericium alpestre]|uniref:Uncharacterized protein n=1 Tax=Hericium alpestre TaxID=135208 RepID=A0A4Y9ZVH3_9AGAM|nr:hypothetical protein EWM64_g5850 [Hericium alpestre]
MSNKRARGLSVTTAHPSSKKARGDGHQEVDCAPERDSVKLYVWAFEDFAIDDRPLAAALPNDLEKLKTWNPKSPDDREGIPELLVLKFPHHHKSLDEDVEGKSRGIVELLQLYKPKEHQSFNPFKISRDGNSHRALMEFTLVNKLPELGLFAAVSINGIQYSSESQSVKDCLTGPHRLYSQGYKWVTAVRIEHEIKTVRSIQRLLRVHIPSAHDDDDESDVVDNEDPEVVIQSDTIKLYAWTYEYEWGQDPKLSAILPSILDKFNVWKPKDKDDDTGLPNLLELNLREHADFQEDIEWRSRDIAKLFKPFLRKDSEFWVYINCEPNFALLEVAVSKDQPQISPFAAVDISIARYYPLDGFMSCDRDKEHYLQK